MPFGGDFGSLRHALPAHGLRPCFAPFGLAQSGAKPNVFVALLLLAYPVEFTFQALFALPRFAERRREFWLQPVSPFHAGFNRLKSLALHARIIARSVTAF